MLKFSFKKSLIAGLIVLYFLPSLCICGNAVNYNNGYAISVYDVNIDVMENNILDITERITMDYQTDKQGFYRVIPVVSSAYREINGKKIKKTHRIILSDFSITDEYGNDIEWIKEREGTDLSFRIGSEGVYNLGEKTYILHYKYDIGEDGIKQFDDFYYNIIGTNWDTYIRNASFLINFPKEFDKNLISFTAGEYQSTKSDISYIVEGNSIIGKTTGELYPYNGVTLRVELPDGYFVGERSNANIFNYVIYAVLLFTAGLCYLLWNKYGRDEQIIETVEFYPPEGMTSAECGYVIDNSADNRDVVSLIIYWADKGYISIEENDKKGFILHKLKEADRSMKSYELTMFNGLFGGRNSVSSDDLKYEFAETVQTVKEQIRDHCNSGSKRLFTVKSIIAQFFSVLLTGFSTAFVLALSIWNGIFDIQLALIMGGICLIGVSVLIGIGGLIISRSPKGKTGKITAIIIVGISVMVPMAISFFISGNILISAFGLSAAIFCGICAIYTAKRTTYGKQVIGKLLGFKNFIIHAEKDRIEMLAAENPKYFYNVLSYAYAMNVTDKWAKKFESIVLPRPDWYYGYNMDTFSAYILLHSLDRNLNRYQRDMTAVKQGNDSGGGFSGGGFGGIGGGGFSGGGFGGGGGSSW